MAAAELHGRPDPLVSGEVRASLQYARDVLATPSTLVTWWTGQLIDAAWAACESARRNLVLIESDDQFIAHRSYLMKLATQVGWPVGSVENWAPDLPADRAQARELWLQAHVANDRNHTAVRQFRNFLVLITAITGMAVMVAAILDGGDRSVIGVGALAGAATTVLPLASATSLSGPYSVTTVQALLRVPSGALAALISVLLLREGLSGLKPATGNTALFYAVLFGFGQTALLKLLDRQASELSTKQ